VPLGTFLDALEKGKGGKEEGEGERDLIAVPGGRGPLSGGKKRKKTRLTGFEGGGGEGDNIQSRRSITFFILLDGGGKKKGKKKNCARIGLWPSQR